MRQNLHVFVVDPQNDFCDLPESYRPVCPLNGLRYAPSLPVPGAHADMVRLARLLTQGAPGISGISVTLDSHHRLHIANTTFWQTGDGAQVPPFTQIAAADVRAGKYAPRAGLSPQRALSYLDRLEVSSRYTLMVWPVHCEIGSWGHNVHLDVKAAYNRWEDLHRCAVNFVMKGSNVWTEHYSAIQAEVVDWQDPGTGPNRALLDLLIGCDRVYIAGEAASHCVKATTEHLIGHLGPSVLEKLVLITDCMSAVSGFEHHYQDFLRDMTARGMRAATCEQVLSELLANVDEVAA